MIQYNWQKHRWVFPIVMCAVNGVWYLLHLMGLKQYSHLDTFFMLSWNILAAIGAQIVINRITEEQETNEGELK